MRFAFVFPGQGSQSVGMMTGFADNRAVRSTFEEASAVLGRDMWKLAQEGPEAEQNLTLNTQPLMLTAGVGVFRAWIDAGGARPFLLAGHSLGEYSAWVAAEAIDFRAALPLVMLRAQAMQEAVPIGAGAMAAVLGLSADAVQAACREAAQGEVVEAVNFNAPEQIVIAGHKAGVERAAALAKSRGARRAVLLPVSAPFHSSLLAPAAERLARELAHIEVRAPRIPVITNVDAEQAQTPASIRDALARQACRPVRWVDCIRHIAAADVHCIAECGPGKVLSGLTRRIAPQVESLTLADEAALRNAMEACARV